MRDRALLIEWLALMFAALLALATGWECAYPSVPDLFMVGRAEAGHAFALGQLAGVGVATAGMVLVALTGLWVRRYQLGPPDHPVRADPEPEPTDSALYLSEAAGELERERRELASRGLPMVLGSSHRRDDGQAEWMETLLGADLPPSGWETFGPGPLAVTVAGALRGVVYVEVAGMAPMLWPEIGKRHELAARILELDKPTRIRLAVDGLAEGRGKARVEPLGEMLRRLDLVP